VADFIVDMWTTANTYLWWQMLLIGLFFLICDFVMFIAAWWIAKDHIVECGYPKRSRKSIIKRWKPYSFLDKLFLIRLCREAECKCFMIYFEIVLYFLNVLAFFACLTGFVCGMVTSGDGWTMTLLVIPQISALCIKVALGFIPDLIFIKSERHRYVLSGKRKKK